MSYVAGIAEIVLWSADLPASLAFYRDLLGLEVISPPNLRNVFLRAGPEIAGIPQMLVLVPKDDAVRAQPSGFQLHHLALSLPAEVFDAQLAALEAAGYAPRDVVHPVIASRTLYVDDPDGNVVELICRASPT